MYQVTSVVMITIIVPWTCWCHYSYAITNKYYQCKSPWILPRQHAATIGGAAIAISCLMVKTKLNQTTSQTLMTALWKPKLNVTFWVVKTSPQRLSHHIHTHIIIFPIDIWTSFVDFQVDASSPILHFPTQSACSFFAPTNAIPSAPLATASSILASLISWKGRRPPSPPCLTIVLFKWLLGFIVGCTLLFCFCPHF